MKASSARAAEGHHFLAPQHRPQKILKDVGVLELKHQVPEKRHHELAVYVDRERAVKVKVLSASVGALEEDVECAAVIRIQPWGKLAPALALGVVPLLVLLLVDRADQRVDLGAHALER
eukprot:6198319-Pleurochrysis_carterae.AAC.1